MRPAPGRAVEDRRQRVDLVLEEQRATVGETRQSVVLSTHILNEVEAICRRVILIHNGRKALDQPIEELTAGGQSLEDVFARVTSRDDARADGEAAA